MDDEKLLDAMAECEQRTAEVKLKDNSIIKGFVDVFEDRCDNEDGKASICLMTEKGGAIIDESQIESIRAIDN